MLEITFFNLDVFFFSNAINLDIFSLILIFLAYAIGFLTLLMSDTRISNLTTSKYLYLNLFVIIVYGFSLTTNLVNMFIFYELLLLPSIAYILNVGYTQRSAQACVYFVIWTQLGSLLVLLAISYIYSLTNFFYFYDISKFVFTKKESTLIFLLLFFGFGFKIPIWPTHYWLTKTHVEASSGFSIFLSGFLVKSALFGFYKISALLNIDISTTFYFIIAIIGCIDSSLKMWGQTDLKKLVAYCTVQEMNLILLCFCLGNSYIILCGILFCITHAFLSALMFFVVDCIYKRYHSRSITVVTGIMHNTPKLGILIFIMIIFFSGIPGTLKFLVEYNLYSYLFEISHLLTIVLIFFVNFVGLIGFCKCWFNALFGFSNKSDNCIIDLTKKEIYISIYCLGSLFFFTFFSFFIL